MNITNIYKALLRRGLCECNNDLTKDSAFIKENNDYFCSKCQIQITTGQIEFILDLKKQDFFIYLNKEKKLK